MAEATPKYKYPNLASALAEFQKTLPSITKTATANAGTYKYSYTPLDKLAAAILPKLAEVGVAYTAAPHITEEGEFVLRAKLIHESGDEFGGDYPLGKSSAPAQAIGSVISYARRYALLSLTGVAPEDEDDDGAKGEEAAGSTRKSPAQKAPAKAPEVTIDSIREKISAILASEDNDLTGDDANAALAKIAKSDDPKKWTLVHFEKALAELEKLAK